MLINLNDAEVMFCQLAVQQLAKSLQAKLTHEAKSNQIIEIKPVVRLTKSGRPAKKPGRKPGKKMNTEQQAA